MIAPFLAALAWFLVGKLNAEHPQPAQAGHSYPLLAKSNCRYASGVCNLENVDFKANLTYQDEVDGGYLQLQSSHPLSGVLLSAGPPGTEPAPQAMTAASNTLWTLPLAARPAPALRLRLVLSAAGSTYFVETGTAFLQNP